MRLVLVVASVMAACVSPSLVTCDDGWQCPSGTTCAAAPQPGDPRCVSVSCGDGVVGPAEDCDGANIGDGTCTQLGFYAGTPRCNPTTCRFDTSTCEGRCGDGMINGDEACDGPAVTTACTTLAARFDYGRPACSAQCTLDLSPCGFFGFGTLYESATNLTTFCAYEAPGNPVVAIIKDPPFAVRTTFGSETVLPGSLPEESSDIGCVSDRAVLVAEQTHRHDGTSWIEVPNPIAGRQLTEVTEFGDSLVSVGYGGLILTGDGTSWNVEHDVPLSPTLYAVWIDPATQTGFAGGIEGSLLRRSVTGGVATWANVTGPLIDAANRIDYIHGVASDDVLIATTDALWRYTGSTWTSQTVPPGPISARGADQVFVGGTDGLLSHFDGRFWSRSIASTGVLRELWMSSRGELYGTIGPEFARATAMWLALPIVFNRIVLDSQVGVPNVWTLAGTQLSVNGASVVPPAAFTALSVHTGVVFTAGQPAVGRRATNGTWTVDRAVLNMTSVTAIGPDLAIAVGISPLDSRVAGIARYASGAWTMTTLPAVSQLTAVASTPTSVIAVGLAGTIIESTDQGMTWKVVDHGFPITSSLTAVWIDPMGTVYVVGRQGVILRRSGSAWSRITTATARDLNAIHGANGTNIVAVGNGVILESDGQTWTPIRPPVAGAPYRAVAVTGNHVYVGGLTGTVGFVLYRAR